MFIRIVLPLCTVMTLSGAILSCASKAPFANQVDGSKSRGPASLQEVIDDVPVMIQKTKSEFRQGNCSDFVRHYAEQVFDKPSGYYFPKTEDETQVLLKNGDSILKNIFALRIAFQETFKTFPSPSEDCIDATRTAIRYTRFAEEAVIDWLARKNAIPAQGQDIFGQPWPYTMTAPEMSVESTEENFKLETGDVLLVRGQTFISATIARIGDGDSQFSHLAIVGEDEKGEKYLVETLIETGAIKHKLSDWLKQKEVRAVVYRPLDRALGKRAGLQAYRKVNQAHLKGYNIPYDFTMNPKDHSQLFCAELVQMAYERASADRVVLPKFKTSYRKLAGSKLLKDLSMAVNETFAPADIELDPRFKLVAEWRHIPTIRKTKVQDAIFTAVFDWMEKRGYEIQNEPIAWFGAHLAFLIRSIGLLPDKMQKHMDPNILKTVIRLQFLAKPVEKHMFKFEQDYYDKNGYSVTFKELLTELERYREGDCRAYEGQVVVEDESGKPRLSEFHWIYRSKDSCAK